LTAPDVDEWVAQAKRLQKDIDTSVTKSEEIVHEHSLAPEGEVEDAVSKVRLLRTEVAFNEGLVATLETISRVRDTVAKAAQELEADEIETAVEKVLKTQDELKAFPGSQSTRLLGDEVAALRNALIARLHALSSQLIHVDREESTITVLEKTDCEFTANISHACTLMQSSFHS
jgi:protein transport protein DSL1/ZW10